MSDSSKTIISEAIAEVAKKHKLVVSENDPIFATIYFQEFLLRKYVEQISSSTDGISEKISESIEEVTLKYTELSKSLANQVVGHSITKTDEIIEKHLKDMDQKIGTILDTKLKSLNNMKNIVVSSTIICGLFTLATAAMIFVK